MPAALGALPALPLHEAGKYVAAAYVVVFALVLIYVAIMAVRLSHIQRELGDELGGILGTLHTHGGQLHARRPPLGARGQDVEIPGDQGDPVGRQHLADLGLRHGQVRRAQFMHLPGQPVPVQRQQGIAAGGQHQAQPGLPPAYQAVQAVEDVRIGQHVRVVDDHDELRLRLGHGPEHDHPAEAGAGRV